MSFRTFHITRYYSLAYQYCDIISITSFPVTKLSMTITTAWYTSCEWSSIIFMVVSWNTQLTKVSFISWRTGASNVQNNSININLIYRNYFV